MGHFLSWGSLLLDDSSMCQLDIKLAITVNNKEEQLPALMLESESSKMAKKHT